MKKTILLLLIAALPALALAACDGQDQEADGHDAADSSHVADQHSHDSHGDTVQDADGHDIDDGKHVMEQDGHDSHGGMDHGNQASAVGSPGDPASIDRSVEIVMDDSMRFTPDHLTFDAGETVRFVVRNNGKIRHEFMLGSMSEIMEHAEMMRAMPTMQHAEANMLTLEAAAEGELVWRFDVPGTVDFACLIPGHLEAGMKGVIQVD